MGMGVLALCFGAASVHAHEAQAPAAPRVAAEPSDWAPAVASYRVTLRRGTDAAPLVQTWTLWRDPQRIALVKPGEVEVWWREPSGIRLERTYHADRRVVEYSAGELRTLQIDVRWLALGTLFDEDLLARLQRGDTILQGRQPVVAYSGQVGRESVALQWDPAWRLPVHLTRRSAAGSVTFERLAVHAEAPAGWAPLGAGSDDYLRIDAADFGDMAGDPFVRKAQAQDVQRGWRTSHGH